jgi:CheY-like chemotaxis protein
MVTFLQMLGMEVAKATVKGLCEGLFKRPWTWWGPRKARGPIRGGRQSRSTASRPETSPHQIEENTMIAAVESPSSPTAGRPHSNRPHRIIVAAETQAPFGNLSHGYSSFRYTFQDSINCRIEMLNCMIRYLRIHGFLVSDPQSPRSILESCEFSPSDVLICDLDLCDGVDLLAKLGGQRPGLAIATSYGDDEDLYPKCFDAGFDVYLAKSEVCSSLKLLLSGEMIPTQGFRRHIFFNKRRNHWVREAG